MRRGRRAWRQRGEAWRWHAWLEWRAALVRAGARPSRAVVRWVLSGRPEPDTPDEDARVVAIAEAVARRSEALARAASMAELALLVERPVPAVWGMVGDLPASPPPVELRLPVFTAAP